MGLVVASKRRGPANVGRRLIEAPSQVRTSEREKGSMLVGRLVGSSGLLKMSSVVRAAKLHMRKWRSSQLNGWELLLLLLKRGSLLDGWELLLLLIVHFVVPAT